ncbi:MAG: hypothetical protein IT431_06630 [Phycisphaerales bacterium]|nr:hypothetical protein [Phycisphaerales bacterium]
MDTHKPICPRCAYDLSGIVESWKDTCPLAGTCSECGLTVAWRDVIAGPLRLPRWSFEHATSNRVVPAFFCTLGMVLVPTRLWRGLRLEMRFAHHRLMLLVLFGMLATKCLGLLLLGGSVVAIAFANGGFSGFYSPGEVAAKLLWPYKDFGGWWHDGYLVSPWVAISTLTVILTPLAFRLLPFSLRRARVSARHIMRVQCYSLALLPWTIGMWSFLGVVYLLDWELGVEVPILSELFYGISRDSSPMLGIVSLVWTVAVLLWFWAAAVRHYLRLDHPLAVAAAMTCVAGLSAAIGVTLMFGHGLFW